MINMYSIHMMSYNIVCICTITIKYNICSTLQLSPSQSPGSEPSHGVEPKVLRALGLASAVNRPWPTRVGMKNGWFSGSMWIFPGGTSIISIIVGVRYIYNGHEDCPWWCDDLDDIRHSQHMNHRRNKLKTTEMRFPWATTECMTVE